MMDLRLGDCLEIMKTIPDKSIDLVLTDPPYGINMDELMASVSGVLTKNAATRKGVYESSGWDKQIPSLDYFSEIMRVSKNQIIFGAEHLCLSLPQSRGWLVWDKKTDDKFSNSFADAELIWTSFDRPTKIIRFLWHGMIQQNMKEKEVRYHPTQKPVSLIKKILVELGGGVRTILDPFMGSGTTGIVCQQMDLDFIGIEINEKYFKIAERRINQSTKELFV